MKTVIHVNQHNIRANIKAKLKRDRLPVLTVKDYKQNRKCNQANILDDDGNIVASIIYSPDKPLSCGARVWIQSELNVEVID